MTHKWIHQGVEFISEVVDQEDLRAWYDRLPLNEIKASITKVKCREYRPYDQAGFRLIVLCHHPFSEQIHPGGGNGRCKNGEIDTLVNSFTNWIDRHNMPNEALLGAHYAFIDWWPIEMLPHVLNDLSPQDQAQLEMNNRFLDNLELIRLAAINYQAFSELWIGSNEPFFAAGRLLYGDFRWVRRAPVNHCRRESNAVALRERVGECSREYVGLVRLALLTDAESPLLDRIGFVIRRFNVQHASEVASWLNLAHDLLDKTDELPFRAVSTNPKLYEEIEVVTDWFRAELVDATQGLEEEIVILLNAILPTLELPPSSVLFADQADR
jgi:hypothetical protein